MALYPTAQCLGGHIERPFAPDDDPNHKIYHLQCLVGAPYYTPISLNNTLASAASAGLNTLPAGIGPDPLAYHIGDSPPTPQQDTPFVTFIRSFATVPANRSGRGRERTHTFPEYRAWTPAPNNEPFTARDVALENGRANGIPPNIVGKSRTLLLVPRVDLTFEHRPDAGLGFQPDDLFNITTPLWYGPAYWYEGSTSFLISICIPEQSNLNHLSDSAAIYADAGISGLPATNPTLTDYRNRIGNPNEYMLIESTVSRYQGHIFQRRNVLVNYH